MCVTECNQWPRGQLSLFCLIIQQHTWLLRDLEMYIKSKNIFFGSAPFDKCGFWMSFLYLSKIV